MLFRRPVSDSALAFVSPPASAFLVRVLALLLSFGLVAPADAAAVRSFCFQKLSGQVGRSDLEQLRLDLDGERVAGFYRWIPWQKDRRIGRLEGRLSSRDTARVLYRFVQEGQKDSARLTVVFNDRQARIHWDPLPQLPGQPPGQPMPPVLLPRHACAELKPVPGL